MKKVTIYTDGACSGNPGVGGWGAVLMYNGVEKRISGAEDNTTNNRMELFAVISALECLKEPCEVTLYSDSAYTVNSFLNGWVYSWEKSGWKKVEFIKVKGHADNEYNNVCDKLATDAVKNYKKA